MVKVQKIRDCRILSPKWNINNVIIYITSSSPKAQGSLKKRAQKDCKSLVQGDAHIKAAISHSTGPLHI